MKNVIASNCIFPVCGITVFLCSLIYIFLAGRKRQRTHEDDAYSSSDTSLGDEVPNPKGKDNKPGLAVIIYIY